MLPSKKGDIMNKNIENIQNAFEVSHLSIIPDGTLHYHNYIEIELIEDGNGTQIINDQSFNLSKKCISILRPYIDNQSLIPHGTEIFDHNFSIQSNIQYNTKCGVLHVISGSNNGKTYIFLSINGVIVAEKFLEENFSCENISFFAKYSTKNIHISESQDVEINFSQSKILSDDDVFSKYDISSNKNIGLPESFILNQNDLSFYNYQRSEDNELGSFIYNCNISIETIGYRIITFKLNNNEKEINFLLSTEKVYLTQVLPQNEFKIYKICINPTLVDIETRKKLLSFNNPLCVNLTDESYENIKRVFELLIYFNKKNKLSNKQSLNLVEILFNIFYDEDHQSFNTNPFKENVLMYFLDNNRFLGDIHLEDFAKYLGYDSGYASRLCLKITGYSFVKYKIHLRLQYAKHQIVSTNIPIAEISIESGFNSLSVFNRFFKKETGYSPSEYRQLHKNKNN